MTFLGRDSFDYAGTAREEASRRARAAARRTNVSRADIARDAADWKAIVARAAYFARDRRALLFAEEERAFAAHMSATVLRTTRAAVRAWHEVGQRPGEEEARAMMLLRLAQKFAELLGDPRPDLDRDGQLVVATHPEQEKAA